MRSGRDRLAFGIIGAGHISDYHITGLREAGAEVLALCGRRADAVRAKAARYGIAHALTDPEALLRRDDIDAVVIAAPDAAHESLALAAVRAGKPMLIQKPMARTAAECRRILRAAGAAGVPVFVSFMHRYFDEVDEARRLVADGALGRLLSVRQRNATPGAHWAAWFYRKADVGGGVVLQLGTHGIDLLRHLLGEIETVWATTATLRPERVLADGTIVRPDNEDHAVAVYRFVSGLRAVHEMDYSEVAGTNRFRLEIYGERGVAWLRTERGRLALALPDATGSVAWSSPDLPPARVGERQHAHLVAMLRGDAPPDDSARAGLVSVLVAEAIYRSAASGCWEVVEPA
ncbi:MAG: Gfo/Idh/MocA family oxidoreductase [Armatimonadota bacterium]|nr:Gfo/Idh/MocA family oxidoreductase [Armatimonadota bacterium]MDR7454676.1 Gfo/Idh/MocA family oxidoreductase [Armatimonadota bacterium]MDR7497712.1 Gfo/Idh/MocA family oxidoreductase [Armatimonadota bacterium]MDR7510693.1 Gfo/Idh/MocA family oxidoreductase [Armatimonadota bacterium]